MASHHPPPLPIKTENDASSVIREDDPRDGLMVPLRTGVHARPAHLVDEIPFCDLSKEGITPEHTCDFHAEDWRGVSCCMFASYMLPQNTVICFFAESVCMLLPSVVRVVSSFPHIHLIAAVTVYLVCDTFFSARSVS